MVTPPYLKKGDKVGIVSTARKITSAQIADGTALIKSWGLVPVIGETIDSESEQYAGTDYERLDDLQAMFNNPEIKAVWCAKGGYGTVRIIDDVDFYRFAKSPKWLIGYSDVTVLHSHIHKMGVETLHAIMPYRIDDNTAAAKESLRKALFGESLKYTIDAHHMNRKGTQTGEVVGGNISMLYSMCGSPSAITTDGKILFLEDLDEYLYHVDRMMMNLKRNGLLKNLCGLIVGGLTKMHDNSVPFGKNAKEIIWDAVKDFDYPVCFDFPAGHLDDNRTLIMGREATLNVLDNNVTLDFKN
ncbi:MAG: LD-carboxypeptidase [Cytophagaceae bacterium]|nr:LD-carboxypeptidase [Cytophagaceae bacterium]|tara:strand:+ start:4835 stop:5734 length:900 start_codon:yes stop_codon:yes gene_type:complete